MSGRIGRIAVCTVLAGAAVVTAAPSVPSVSAAPTELFFSEYIEGSSNNKALEIYNGTGVAVNLGTGAYSVQMHFNGNPVATLTINLSGTVATGDVFVLAHSSADPAILAQADQTNGAGWFNGDDAVVLRKGTAVIDVIGQIGFDPGTEWGSGLTSTADNTLRRKAAIEAGDPNGADVFDPAIEWEGFATNTFDALGAHPGSPTPPEPEIGACGDPATAIHAVQGSGSTSPLDGSVVEVEGIVTGDFQTNASLSGFYLQEEDAQVDSDPATSEGIFVFDGGAPAVDVTTGAIVRVKGEVDEFNGLTELKNVVATVVCPGTGVVTPTLVTLPVPSFDAFESHESMLVTLAPGLVVTETFSLGRFGSLSLATERLRTPTDAVEPGPAAIAYAAANDLMRIELDDARSVQNPNPVPYLGADGTRRVGDTTSSAVTGNLEFSFGLWRIQPTAPVTFSDSNPRPAAPGAVGGDLRVASFNVLNFFTTIDTGAPICGPENDQECRGADNPGEFETQRNKILDALLGLDADVVGLLELENNASESLQSLVDGLNAATEPGRWDFVDTGTIGTDAIKVGLIYRTDTVALAGDHAILDSGAHPLFDDTLNRPALAQSFTQLSDGAVFTAVVNHLKSKGSDCDDVGDVDTGDGQGNCNLTRTRAAQALVEWLATDPTGSGDVDVLVIGDLNSYAKEDPIDVFVNAGYVDEVRRFGGDGAYSYVFEGESGYLDHALANTSLDTQVTGATEWHINADEPSYLDYDTQFEPFFAPGPYRSSDHDPVLVGLDLNAAPSCAAARPTVASTFPPNGKFTSVGVVGVTDADGDTLSVTITSVFQDEKVGPQPDAQLNGSTAKVRAERDGSGDGRVYHVSFTASDGRGESCDGSVTVAVPHDKSGKKPAIDGGALYDSTVV